MFGYQSLVYCTYIMKKPYVLAAICAVLCFFALLYILTRAHGFILLDPVGLIAIAERDLLVRAVLLMCIVVVPVILLAIFIAWHYREQNTKAKYTPDWEHSKMEELIWWSIPLEIVLVLGALTWSSTHALNPETPIPSTERPLTVEVVALPWKWLFIYPEENVASINELALPIDRPVTFHITADAPMNSFWIPALSGQMYAMTGMATVLNIITYSTGTYTGRSANYSGEGFADMTFTVHALTQDDFAQWVAHAKEAPEELTEARYASLSVPSERGPVTYFRAVTVSFDDIVARGMGMESHRTSPVHHEHMTLPPSSATVGSTSTTTP